MLFSQSVVLAVLSLGSLSLAAPAPVENAVAVEGITDTTNDVAVPQPQPNAKKAPCNWFSNILGSDCDDDDDDDDRRPAARPSPRPQPRPTAQPQRPQPRPTAQPQPRPASPPQQGNPWLGATPNGQAQPRPASPPQQGNPWLGATPNGPAAQPAPKGFGQPANSWGGGQQQAAPAPAAAVPNDAASTWCERPNEARRPDYCNNGGRAKGSARTPSPVNDSEEVSEEN